MKYHLVFTIWLLDAFLGASSSSSGGFYADNGLQQSVKFMPLNVREKKQLESEILHLLGMNGRPKKLKHRHNMHESAQKFLLDLYQQETSNDTMAQKNNYGILLGTQYSDADSIVSFVNKINHQFPHLRHEKDRRFFFDVSEIPSDEQIVGAELHIYRNSTNSKKSLQKTDKITFNIYAVSEDSINSNKLDFVNSLTIPSAVEGWLKINVSAPVIKWITLPDTNLGFYAKIKLQSGDSSHFVRPEDVGIASFRAPEEYRAFLVAYFKTSVEGKRRLRSKRAARPKKSNDAYYSNYSPYSAQAMRVSKNCERWNLYVSFKDLGWEDWIIAPDGYGAFYCQGHCTFPLNANMNATNHAIVQTLVHLMEPSRVPKPCCAPTALSSITVLYFDDNSNVILKKYRNMVVSSCGCH